MDRDPPAPAARSKTFNEFVGYGGTASSSSLTLLDVA